MVTWIGQGPADKAQEMWIMVGYQLMWILDLVDDLDEMMNDVDD